MVDHIVFFYYRHNNITTNNNRDDEIDDYFNIKSMVCIFVIKTVCYEFERL